MFFDLLVDEFADRFGPFQVRQFLRGHFPVFISFAVGIFEVQRATPFVISQAVDAG